MSIPSGLNCRSNKRPCHGYRTSREGILVRTKASFRTVLSAVVVATPLLVAPVRAGDCCSYRPLWIAPSEPIPACATHTGGPYTFNPFRFAHGTPAAFCRPRLGWPCLGFHSGVPVCDEC